MRLDLKLVAKDRISMALALEHLAADLRENRAESGTTASTHIYEMDYDFTQGDSIWGQASQVCVNPNTGQAKPSVQGETS